ncbi:hypothetical protein NQZ68_012653 [Dissostichus eleginoides]|nr:hypothetical protein NQZ68_012653 [Dissostichus eleginoides]
MASIPYLGEVDGWIQCKSISFRKSSPKEIDAAASQAAPELGCCSGGKVKSLLLTLEKKGLVARGFLFWFDLSEGLTSTVGSEIQC